MRFRLKIKDNFPVTMFDYGSDVWNRLDRKHSVRKRYRYTAFEQIVGKFHIEIVTNRTTPF